MIDEGHKRLAQNPRAHHKYEILETYEAGVVLTGPEIKAIREGKMSLREGYGVIRDGEAWLVGVHIAPYTKAQNIRYEPERDRKLLLHREEIARIDGKIREKGLTFVPLECYLKSGRAKILMALVRGKRAGDRRREILEREQEREIQRAISGRRRKHRGEL
ncbi:MAG: SsrA-binding protein SmpB [bacterium JZ-2024 1]